jgi:VanZ family protein
MRTASLRWLRLWQGIGIGLIVFVAYESLNRDPLQLDAIPGNGAGHLLAYGTLMLWHSQWITPTGRRVRLAAGLALMGLLLEVAQYFTGYRSFDLADAAANALGILAGWLCAPPRLPNFLELLEAWLAPRA